MNNEHDLRLDGSSFDGENLVAGADGFKAESMAGGAELDSLLREWHESNAVSARVGRDRLMEALGRERSSGLASSTDAAAESTPIATPPHLSLAEVDRQGTGSHRHRRQGRGLGFTAWRGQLAAAAVIVLALVASFIAPSSVQPQAVAQLERGFVMAPEGGRLDAIDGDGNVIGPFVLLHTDVDVDVTNRFARVTLKQKYYNPHPDKIEAVYTFPMSHRATVDRMRMIIGDRVVEGEVRERQEARRIYEQARDTGRVASLLEQERPNIFTQSVANIEPGVRIDVEISYVETVQERDGDFRFEFPMTVAPRYIPGGCIAPIDDDVLFRPVRHDRKAQERNPRLPDYLDPRRGLVLLSPGKVLSARAGDTSINGEVQLEVLDRILADAIPIQRPKSKVDTNSPPTHLEAPLWYEFTVRYDDGSQERGRLLTDHTGELAGRWFYSSPLRECKVGEPEWNGQDDGLPKPPIVRADGAGEPFAKPTAQVPDAHRITPMPTHPDTRAGHDVSLSIKIDGGGAGIIGAQSALHEIMMTGEKAGPPGVGGRGVYRSVEIELANRSEIPNRDFVLTWRKGNPAVTPSVFTHAHPTGNFLGVFIDPPTPDRMNDALAVPRELVFVLDTSGSMSGTPIEAAKRVMTKAIGTMRPRDTFNVITFAGSTRVLWPEPRAATAENIAEAQRLVESQSGGGGTEMMKAIEAALMQPARPAELAYVQPLRVVMFLTDGEVGNEMAIIDAVKTHRATTRVFSFGVGNSVNRYLLNGIAQAGGGAAEYVLLPHHGDGPSEGQVLEVVERFTRRMLSPVLTNIRLEFSPELGLTQITPSPDNIPDVFDISPVTIFAKAPMGRGPVSGTVTLKGNTVDGPWEKSIPVTLPGGQLRRSDVDGTADGGVLPALWARSWIDAFMNQDLRGAQKGNINPELRRQIVALGTKYSIMSQYTSFVAVDKLRVTVGGKPRLVQVPIEFPDQEDWRGYFGGSNETGRDVRSRADGVEMDEALEMLIFNGHAAGMKDALAAGQITTTTKFLGEDVGAIGFAGGTDRERTDGSREREFAFSVDIPDFETEVDRLREQINLYRAESDARVDRFRSNFDERESVLRQWTATDGGGIADSRLSAGIDYTEVPEIDLNEVLKAGEGGAGQSPFYTRTGTAYAGAAISAPPNSAPATWQTSTAGVARSTGTATAPRDPSAVPNLQPGLARGVALKSQRHTKTIDARSIRENQMPALNSGAPATPSPATAAEFERTGAPSAIDRMDDEDVQELVASLTGDSEAGQLLKDRLALQAAARSVADPVDAANLGDDFSKGFQMRRAPIQAPIDAGIKEKEWGHAQLTLDDESSIGRPVTGKPALLGEQFDTNLSPVVGDAAVGFDPAVAVLSRIPVLERFGGVVGGQARGVASSPALLAAALVLKWCDYTQAAIEQKQLPAHEPITGFDGSELVQRWNALPGTSDLLAHVEGAKALRTDAARTLLVLYKVTRTADPRLIELLSAVLALPTAAELKAAKQASEAQTQPERSSTDQASDAKDSEEARLSESQTANTPIREELLRKPIGVIVLLADTADGTLKAVKAAGLKVESVLAKEKVAAGTVALQDVPGLAVLEQVRKVEAVEMAK